MTAPPGPRPDSSSTARPAVKGATVDPAFRRRLVDAGCWVAAQRGRPVLRARVRELVDRFLADGRSDLINHDRTVESFRAWFITYADPTGELAAHRVDRERGCRA